MNESHYSIATRKKIMTVLLTAGVCHGSAMAQPVDVEVNVNVKHEVGGVSTFDRSKFITIHASHTSNDWNDGQRGADNFTNDLLADFILGYDVYFGRDTGYISWHIKNNIDEDPGNPGWVKVSGAGNSMVTEGQQSRNSYNSKTWLHAYEDRLDGYVIAAQFQPFWPEGYLDCGPSGSKWALSTNDTPSEPFGSASGHYMGHFLNEFYGSDTQVGVPLPTYVEVMNEPDWPLFEWSGDPEYGTSSPAELWTYHNSVANQIRAQNTNALIGGYCPAFADLERDNFEEWTDEWITFIDTCGTNMDFYALHFYDIDSQDPGNPRNLIRRGSHTEAVFDMIEHYSQLQLGKQLSFAITEYAGKDTYLYSQGWSALHDWKRIKSMSGFLMTFMDRPNLIGKTIPFTMLKEEWWRNYGDGIPHGARLMRQIDEDVNPTNATGEWVYTEHIKWYDLWRDVNGTRVDIASSDPDIQVDAYVNSNKAYVILNNLNTTSNTVDLSLFEDHGNTVLSVREKNLYWDGSTVALDDIVHAGSLSQVQLGIEGTAVLEYTFTSPVTIDQTSDEVKYYATTYFQPITNSVANVFSITNVTTGTYGDAVLRLGIGRDTGLSRKPQVLFNGIPLIVPTDFMGHEGDDRTIFFGTLEIPVPYGLLQPSNTVSVTFHQDGGYIASVALRAFEFSSNIRSLSYDLPVDWLTVAGTNLTLGTTNGPADGHFSLLSKTSLTDAGWALSQGNLPLDNQGVGSVTNPMTAPTAFFKLIESDEPLPDPPPPPPEPTVIEFVSPDYGNGGLNNQQDWNAESGWTVADAAGSGNAYTLDNSSAATLDDPVILSVGETYTLSINMQFTGSYSTPTGYVYTFLGGLKDSAAGASLSTDNPAADANIQLMDSSDKYRLLDTWDQIGNQITGGALNDGDILQFDYELTLGADASSTSYSVRLQNLTDGTDTGAGVVNGVNASIYNALTGSGAYAFFQTISPAGSSSGLTGVQVNAVSVNILP